MNVSSTIKIQRPESVYPPSEDTFLLLRAIELGRGESFLEVGCGSGIISIHAAKIAKLCVATDISREAAIITAKNARANSAQVDVVRADLLYGIRGTFDVVVFNPPYLPSDNIGKLSAEDKRALIGGNSGFEETKRFLLLAKNHVVKGGRCYIIVSSLQGDLRDAIGNLGFNFKTIRQIEMDGERLEALLLTIK